jgi:hypothetical protein
MDYFKKQNTLHIMDFIREEYSVDDITVNMLQKGEDEMFWEFLDDVIYEIAITADITMKEADLLLAQYYKQKRKKK